MSLITTLIWFSVTRRTFGADDWRIQTTRLSRRFLIRVGRMSREQYICCVMAS